MATAKVPSKTGEWDSIDIFLFSNGQQCSPPRKYHLRHEELNCWGATLGFLALSQYGSMHSSINLYTIEGQKIDGPTDISNGAAYVAVKPPDAFIPAGYDKYLIKASKSWDKRRARKPSVDISNPDQTNVKNITSKTEINVESRNISSSKQDVAEERIITKTTNEEITATLKPKAIANHRRQSDSNTLSSLKQIERRRPPVNQRNNIIRKNNTNPISYPPTIRKASDKRRDSPKKSLAPEKINYKETIAKNKDKANNNNMTVMSVIKNNEQPLHTVESITKLEETTKGMTLSSSTKIINLNHKSLTTDDSQMQNLLADREIVMISNSYKNPESEMASTQVAAEEQSLTFKKNINKEQINSSALYIPLLNEDRKNPELMQEKLNSNGNIIIENTRIPSNSKNKIVQDSSQHLTNDVIVTEKPNSNHNHIAVISRGDVVHLKLNIEVRNGVGIVSTRHANTHMAHPSCDILKLDKGSQVDIELKLSRTSLPKPNHEIYTQCRSLESILASEYLTNFNDDRNTKVIIIQCNCCDHHYNTEDLLRRESSMRENKTYILLLPSEKQNSKRCACNRTMSQTIEKELENTEVTTKKSITSLSKCDPAEFVSTRRDIIVPVSSIESALSQKEETYQRNEYVVTKLNASPFEDDHQKLEYIVTRKDPPETIEEAQKTEFVVIRKNALFPKSVTDKFTQTEWYGVLLEARRHEDGRYSFHLPPLHVLRNPLWDP